MRITRGNPHFLFKFRHSSKQDSHIVFINFRKLLHRQRIFSQPRLDGISRTVIKIDKPVFVSGIPGRRRCFLDPVTAHFCKIFRNAPGR